MKNKVEDRSATYEVGTVLGRFPLPVPASAAEVGTCESAEISARMKAARESLGLTQAALALSVGGSKRGIQDNEARNRVPGGEVICGLVRLGINANWLLTGEGPMLKADLIARADLEAAWVGNGNVDVPDTDRLAAAYEEMAPEERAAVDGLVNAIERRGFTSWYEAGKKIAQIANVFKGKVK